MRERERERESVIEREREREKEREKKKRDRQKRNRKHIKRLYALDKLSGFVPGPLLEALLRTLEQKHLSNIYSESNDY